jgi:hypothetical protein
LRHCLPEGSRSLPRKPAAKGNEQDESTNAGKQA